MDAAYGFVVGRLDLDVVQARGLVIGQAGGTGILVVHVRHQVGHFLDPLDAFDRFQRVHEFGSGVFVAGDTESDDGHGGSFWLDFPVWIQASFPPAKSG